MFEYQLPLSSTNIATAGYAPAVVTFQPSAYVSAETVHTIVYDFNNSEQHKVVYTEFPADLNLPTILPKNITVDHFIEHAGTYTGTISVYKLNTNTPDVISYSITLSTPDIFELNLLKSSMNNTTNEMLYVFESKNPRLVAPVKIHWPQKRLAEPTKLTASSISYIHILGSLNNVSELDAYLSAGLATGDAFQIGSDLYVYDALTNTFTNIGRTSLDMPDYIFVMSDEDFIPFLSDSGEYFDIV